MRGAGFFCWGGTACALLALACEPTPPEGTGGVQVEEAFGVGGLSCGRGVAVILTDYASTNVALLGLDGEVLSASFISSASADPSLNAPLTGDVAFPSSRMGGDVILLDRFPASVLTSVDVASAEVTQQVVVRTGFDANPQDLVGLSDGSALVSRLEKNRDPGEEEFDEGDDLLRIEGGEITERIDLSDFADASTGRARPGAMVRDSSHVFVSLTRHDAGFDEAGEASILVLDGETGEPQEAHAVSGMKNCSGLALSPDARQLAVSCGGLVSNANGATPDHSGVVVFRIGEDASLNEEFRLTTEELGAGPFSSTISFAADDWLWVGTYGALEGEDAGRPDRVFSIDLESGDTKVQIESSEDAFNVGSVLCVAPCGVCFIADAGRGVVHRYGLSGKSVASVSGVRIDDGIGLPPRGLGWF